MPKRHQQHHARAIVGRNNPSKSTEITTGPPKKRETYRKQALAHDNPGKPPQQVERPPAAYDPSLGITHQANSRARIDDREQRSGSDSNAHQPRKGFVVERSVRKRQPQKTARPRVDFERDLHPSENMNALTVRGYGQSAYAIKELYTILADFTDDELKSIMLLPTGTRLEQGAKYIDLRHLERGEFTANADMVVEPGHYVVAKKETDYVLWNRLRQINIPARLDESNNP
ncbi:MAG TPA: hypothetical protein VHZ51_03365 [Ktedonobacteraceae bacterium]|jgi:hypothetical protein|nr:hypothetical protein [Ktedonobacteraceae bacterium]